MQPTLFSVTRGDKRKPTLVFLHGFMGNSRDWLAVVTALADDFYCICFDLPGHGKSSPLQLPEKEGFNVCSQLIEQGLTELGVTDFSFVGYSMGGRLALHYGYYWQRQNNTLSLKHLFLESAKPFAESAAAERLSQDLLWAERFKSRALNEVLGLWYQQS